MSYGPGPIDPKELRGDFGEVNAVRGGKRLAVVWAPWMGDWFSSHSPRNDNSNAEGQWGQWAHMAAQILAHPLTRLVAPELYRPDLPYRHDLYDATPREATEAEIIAAEYEHRRNLQAKALGLPLDADEEARARALAASRAPATEGDPA